jgi:hypothetical protein
MLVVMLVKKAMNIFHIKYRNSDIQTEQQGNDDFTVHMDNRQVHLHRKQDNEGENHWFEEGADNETEETKELGVAIEAYLIKQQA